MVFWHSAVSFSGQKPVLSNGPHSETLTLLTTPTAACSGDEGRREGDRGRPFSEPVCKEEKEMRNPV